jgi:hypothetical protein
MHLAEAVAPGHPSPGAVTMKIVQAGLLRRVRIMAMLDDPRFVCAG